MIEKTLSGMSGMQGESYYFQLYPLSLSIVGEESIPPAAGTTYRFTVLKGQQKFDENKLPIDANFKRVNGVDVMVIPKCPLNFYVPSFNKARKTEFLFKMYQTEKNEEYDIGEYVVNVEPYITEYKENRTVRFQQKHFFSDDYELEFQIYIEKSRFALEKVVKDYKVERGLKSPLKERKEASVNNSGAKRGLTSPQVAKSAINQTPSKDEPEKHENNNNDQKEREQLRTEMDSQNPKQSRQSKEESVYSNMRDSRSSARGAEKKEEEPRTVQATQSEIRQFNQSGKKNVSIIKPADEAQFEERSSRNVKVHTEESSAKNERYSQSASEKKVPVVQVKMKQLSKEDTPAQVRLEGSQRLSTSPNAAEVSAPPPQLASRSGTSTKDKILLSLFILVSFYLMYLAMHPNKKV